MTRKDFVALADLLRAQKEEAPALGVRGKERVGQNAAHMTWCKLVQATADLCQTHAKTFNRRRFLIACGLVGS